MVEVLILMFLFQVVGTIVVGTMAASRERGAVTYIFLCWLLTPVIPFFMLLALGHSGVQCATCKEWVKENALKCKHCGQDFRGALPVKTGVGDEKYIGMV